MSKSGFIWIILLISLLIKKNLYKFIKRFLKLFFFNGITLKILGSIMYFMFSSFNFSVVGPFFLHKTIGKNSFLFKFKIILRKFLEESP